MSHLAHRLLNRFRCASKRRSGGRRTGELHAAEGGGLPPIEESSDGQWTATWEARQQHGHSYTGEPFFERPSLHDSAMEDDEEDVGVEVSHPSTARISHRDSLCVERSVWMRAPKEGRKWLARFGWPLKRERIRAPARSFFD